MVVFITGGLGFIGSAVVKKAIERGYSVVNIDSLTYAASRESVTSIADNPNYIFELADISNYARIEELFFKYQPDALINLAAETHVDRSISDPQAFIKTNVIGTFNLLEVTRKYLSEIEKSKNFRFHHVSTDEVFGSLELGVKEKFTEKSPYKPNSPYSASKASSDHFVRSWYTTYGLPILISNCSNNYGPFQHPEKLIPLMIIKGLMNQRLPIYGSGDNIRDWLFVNDHADGIMTILDIGEIGRSYNIGGENEMTNVEIVKLICSKLDQIKPRQSGLYSDLISHVSDRPGHDKRYAIDNSRISDELNWKPKVEFEEGLELTIDWYLKNQSWWQNRLNLEKE